MDTKKIVKTVKIVAKAVPIVTATVGVLSLALSKYQEKQGDFSREFPDIENDIKNTIDQVRYENGN